MNFDKAHLEQIASSPTVSGLEMDLAKDLLVANLQVEELQKKVSEQRKMLWWCARDAGLCLHIPKAELESIPEGAELLVWYEKLFDSMALKGICSPTGQGEPVVEKTNQEKRKDEDSNSGRGDSKVAPPTFPLAAGLCGCAMCVEARRLQS